MESSAAPEAPRRLRTIVSPSLARDLRRLKRAAPFLAVLLLVVGAFCMASFGSGIAMGPQEQWTTPLATAIRFGLSPQTVSFTSADGIPLKAWWEQPWNVAAPKGTVILVHGSQTNKTGMGYTAARLVPQGFSVMLLDLRAHGESGGDYTTFGYKEALDVEAAIQWTKAHASGGRIALLGYSSGAVAALFAAAQTPDIAAVVADSAYVDAEDVLRREKQFLDHAPSNVNVPFGHRTRLWLFTAPGFAWFSRGVFRLRAGVPFEPPEANVLKAVERIDRAQVLYLAAEQDPVVPRAVTEQLYRATASPNKQVSIRPGAFHSAMAADPPGYVATVLAFLEGAFGAQPVPGVASPQPH